MCAHGNTGACAECMREAMHEMGFRRSTSTASPSITLAGYNQLVEENERLRAELQRALEQNAVPGLIIDETGQPVIARSGSDDTRALREFVQDIAEAGFRADLSPTRRWPADETPMQAIRWFSEYMRRVEGHVSDRARAALRNPAGPTRDTVLEAACRAWWAVESATGEPWEVDDGGLRGTAAEGEAVLAALAARNEVRARVRALLTRGALETEVERRTRREGSCLGDAAALACGLELWGLAGKQEERGEQGGMGRGGVDWAITPSPIEVRITSSTSDPAHTPPVATDARAASYRCRCCGRITPTRPPRCNGCRGRNFTEAK